MLPIDDHKEVYKVDELSLLNEKYAGNDDVEVVNTVNPLDAIKNFSKPNLILVAEALASTDIGMKFGDLRNQTGFDNNTLNHTLREMKKEGYVKQVDKVWCLTKFGYIVLKAVKTAKYMVVNLTKRNILHDEVPNVTENPEAARVPGEN